MANAVFDIAYSVKESGRRAPSWDLENDLDGSATLADILRFTKGALIKISSDVLKEEQALGFDKNPTLIVDGKYNKKVDQVNPLGKIQYVARQPLKQLILDTYDAIRFRTKIVTGEYGKNNIVTFNGLQVANNLASLKKWLDSKNNFENRDIIRFINTAPYARKLERLGVTAQRTKIKQESHKRATAKNRGRTFGRKAVLIPNGVYALAFKAIQSKYKNNAFIRFRLVQGSDLGLVGPGRVYKTGKTKGRPYLYPSILISAVEAGMTDGKKS
jgi:hypothetical protein